MPVDSIPPPIQNDIGFAVTISLFVLIFLLLAAKSYIHSKCRQHLIESSSLDDYVLAPDIKIERPQEKTQSNFVSQIYPSSTLRLQIYETSINHYLAAIRVPLVQVALTVLLYSFPFSELSENVQNGNMAYNAVFHSIQIAALLSFYVVSNMDPGIIAPHPVEADSSYDPIEDTPAATTGTVDSEPSTAEHPDEERQKLLTDGDGQKTKPAASSWSSSVPSTSISKMLFPSWFAEGLQLDMDHFQKKQPIEIECEWSNDSTVPEAYCRHCYFLHPIRARHCYEMGYCIARYDHYCRMIENAVGANNLRFVVGHLVLDSVTYTWELCMFIYVLVVMATSGTDSVLAWILGVFCCGLLLVCALVRTIHLLDHIQTISKNQTIAEKVDPQPTIDVLSDGYHDYDDDDREIDYHDRYFDEGFFKNWFLCLTGYRQNREYMHGIRCVLKFDQHQDALLSH